MKEIQNLFSNMFAKILTVFTIVFLCVSVFAQVPAPESVEGFVTIIPKFLEAIATKNYVFAGALAVMFVVVAFRQFALPKLKIGTEWLSIVAIFVGQVLSIAQALTAPGVTDWRNVVLTGLVWALLGSGLWSSLGKAIIKKLLGDKYVEPKAELKLVR